MYNTNADSKFTAGDTDSNINSDINAESYCNAEIASHPTASAIILLGHSPDRPLRSEPWFLWG